MDQIHCKKHRHYEEAFMPTWQSRKKIAKNAMKFIIFRIAAPLTAARNDDTGIHATILSRFQALLHGSNFRCHSCAGGNLENNYNKSS
ncbi:MULTISPECIES: hypothetical protein [unclassified Rickettsia]|uniref:hypothetical protein n=1 Tax=unclassified Rickettsia TaxID=114295 RepID=UPI0031330BD9